LSYEGVESIAMLTEEVYTVETSLAAVNRNSDPPC